MRVGAGDYRERVVVKAQGTNRAPVAFVAQTGARVSLRGDRNGFYLSNASWVTISGFTIIGTSSYGISVTNASHISLVRNRVSGSGKQLRGSLSAGIYLNNVSNSLVWRNVSSGNSYAGIVLTFGATRNVVKENTTYGNRSGIDRRAPGIRLYNAPNNTVTGNISYGNEDSGIELYSGSSTVSRVEQSRLWEWGSRHRCLRVRRRPGRRQYGRPQRDRRHQCRGRLKPSSDREQHRCRQRRRQPSREGQHSSRS